MAAVGGGVLALAAGWEIDATDRHRLLHRLGWEGSPDRQVAPAGTPVEEGSLSSGAMRRAVHWSISRPRPPIQGVIICLHGKGEDHRMAFDRLRIPDFVAAAGRSLAVAAVDGGDDSYWHPRVDGSDALSMLMGEFLPLVERRLGPVPRALLGWSMGGYGALLVAERSPAMFRAVAAGSPALWTEPGATAPGAFDSAEDYRRFDVFAGVDRLVGMPVRVDCGRGDPFYAADRHFVAQLRGPHESAFGAGYHDDAFWRSAAPAQIAFLGRALA